MPVTGILNGIGFAFIFGGVCLAVLELDTQRGDALPGWAYAATWGLFLAAMDLPAVDERWTSWCQKSGT